MLSLLRSLLVLVVVAVAPRAGAEVPFPVCALPNCDPACAIGDGSCTGPDDYADYLFIAPGALPNDYNFDPNNPTRGEEWLYQGVIQSGPAAGVRGGHDIVGAWEFTTGRPDVTGAVLDSGIRWNSRDLAKKAALNVGELPLPDGCPANGDCNGDGVVNVTDFDGEDCAGGTISDAAGNANGFIDAQDLIIVCSDDVDDDANGYVDDISGWDFWQDDNDPFDDTDAGHGTGEAGDQVNETNNFGSQAGVAPASMYVPLRVGDHFVTGGTNFAQAAVYAVDLGVDYISEALGTISQGPSGQAAVDYAYENDVPIIASAADEQARHHNYPSNYEHTIWVNSVRTADGDFIEEATPPQFDIQNGCTNHGGRAWAAIGSVACSSEATARAGGMTSLLIARGKNLMDAGLLSPYTPGSSKPFSAEEVRQIYRVVAVDIDHSADPSLSFTEFVQDLVDFALSALDLGLIFETSHFPDQAGWDQYTGYGRPDMVAAMQITEETIPPEVDLSGSVRWFEIIDPTFTPVVPIVGSARATRAPGPIDWSLQVGCGVQPTSFTELASDTSAAALELATFHSWDPAATAASCGFDPADRFDEPDAHSVTLRLQVVDSRGNLGEDRRTVAVDADPTLLWQPLVIGASGESSPTLADVNGDGTLDIVFGSAAGEVHAVDGATGDELPGFPVQTAEIAVHASPAYSNGVPVPREAIMATTAVDDLDDDGDVEIVAATWEGSVHAWDHLGNPLPGFPVATNPAFSDSSLVDPFNDLDPGIFSSPTLGDLDPPPRLVTNLEVHTDLEIVVGANDGHLYAWRHDGQPVEGFPVKLADENEVTIDPDTGKITPKSGEPRERQSKIISSAAIGDLDGDGANEIIIANNEQFLGEPNLFDAESNVWQVLKFALGLVPELDQLELDAAGRMYAVNHDGSFLPGWPVSVPLLVTGILPTVASGIPGSPALADIDGSGELVVAIFPTVGPVMIYDKTGAPLYPPADFDDAAGPAPLPIDFPDTPDLEGAIAGFPAVPETAGSPDAPFFAILGSGAFGDLTGDGLPEYVAPTAGIRKVIDIIGPGQQGFADHQLAAWDPRERSLLPAFPVVMDDMQFLASPAIADVTGDGLPEVLNGSGSYLIRAYSEDGSTPADFPKFTHGWQITSPAVGDVTGDDFSEVVAISREGVLLVWTTPGRPHERAIPWQGFGRDRRNSQNLASGVATTIPACSDQRDNDGDGDTDALADDGCVSPQDPSEVLGDHDFDGLVDLSDRDVLYAAFGSSTGDPMFVDSADLDRDGTITWVDYQLWLDAFRNQPPPPIQFACGLLGIEPLVLLPLLARRLRRRSPGDGA